MKKFISEFMRRGFAAAGIGPIVLAILYLILQRTGNLDSLTVHQVCMGIFSTAALSFIAGGMNAVYQIERLPLMVAILIHGSILYISYLITYLLNAWFTWSAIPIAIFTAVFIVGYLAIWAIIYSVTKRKTDKFNEVLKRKQQNL